MKEIIIKTAAKADIPAILDIIKIGFTRYSVLATSTAASPALSETVEDVLRDLETKQVFVATSDGEAVGTVRVYITGDIAYVSRFASKVQGSGIGTRLIEAAALYAKKEGATMLTLHTAASAKSTVGFYKKLGFYTLSEENTRGYRRLYMGKQI